MPGDGAAQQVASDTTYDGLGRVATGDTPWRNVGNTEPALGTFLTQYAYDGLSRPVAVTNPDGSSRTVSYSGNATAYTDEAGKSKTVTTDGLARVKQVVEDPNNLKITTAYTWSPTGNLTAVT